MYEDVRWQEGYNRIVEPVVLFKEESNKLEFRILSFFFTENLFELFSYILWIEKYSTN